jgi:phenylalanyl-tRNA synthetase alpha chain
MPHPLEELREAALREITEAHDEAALDAVRVRYLGRSGALRLGEQMKSLGGGEADVGKLLNEVRAAVTAAIAKRRNSG